MSAKEEDENKTIEENKTKGNGMVKLELSPPPMKQPILSAREDLLTKYGLFDYYNEFSKPYNGTNPEKTLDLTFKKYVDQLSGKQDYEPDNYLVNLVMQPERNSEPFRKYTERETRKAFILIKEPPVPKEIKEYIEYESDSKKGMNILDHSNNNYPPLPKVHIRPPAQKDSPDELDGEDDRDRSEKKHKKKKKKRKHDKEREEEDGSPSSEKKKKKKKKKKGEKYERDSEDE